MAGRAVLEAAEDVINQLKKIASHIFRASEEDIEIKHEKVFYGMSLKPLWTLKKLCMATNIRTEMQLEGKS